MRIGTTALVFFCSTAAHAAGGNLQVAEDFISAFYTFEPTRLGEVVDERTEGYGSVMYYQGWAEGGNYRIKQRRSCRLDVATDSGDSISCAITVTDDFGTAMGYVATDTFALQIFAGRIRKVTFSADDPPIFQELLTWIGERKPEILAGPCLDFFAGGETPQACAKAVAGAARGMMAECSAQGGAENN